MDEEFLEETHKQTPNLSLTQLVYRCEISQSPETTASLQQQILEAIEEDKMAPYYDYLCNKYGWQRSDEVYSRLTAESEAELSKIQEQHQYAIENAGDMEILDALFAKARCYARIGDKAKAYEAFNDIIQKEKVSTGKKIDATMDKARVAMFWLDIDVLKEAIASATKLNDQGGDWDRRNRLKVYEAILLLTQRDVRKAARLLLDCVATFTCVEVCSYEQFMFYVVLTNIMTLPRAELKKKVIQSPQVLSVLRRLPFLPELLNSIYDCEYAQFFRAMIGIHPTVLQDRYLGPHAAYIVREYRVLAYSQFLDAYKSVMLSSMAQAFGVNIAFLDGELARFIAAGRLTAKIDKVGDVIETNRPDKKNAQYQEVIKKGDVLLNQIQKLARVVDA